MPQDQHQTTIPKPVNVRWETSLKAIGSSGFHPRALTILLWLQVHANRKGGEVNCPRGSAEQASGSSSLPCLQVQPLFGASLGSSMKQKEQSRTRDWRKLQPGARKTDSNLDISFIEISRYHFAMKPVLIRTNSRRTDSSKPQSHPTDWIREPTGSLPLKNEWLQPAVRVRP